MKKLILLAIAAVFTFVSCSEDDDAGSQDQIVGVWTLHKEFENGVEEFLTDCEKQEKLVFNNDGTFLYEYYYQEDEMSDCILDEESSGTWSNDGNNSYAVSTDFDNVALDIIFEGNTFYYEDVYTEGEETETYRIVYIRN